MLLIASASPRHNLLAAALSLSRLQAREEITGCSGEKCELLHTSPIYFAARQIAPALLST
jgi:hypothetical protein